MLRGTKWFEEMEIKEPNPMHLLWGLRFLKKYKTEEDHAAEVGKDKKTWQKWCWLYVKGVAKLSRNVVSFVSCFI